MPENNAAHECGGTPEERALAVWWADPDNQSGAELPDGPAQTKASAAERAKERAFVNQMPVPAECRSAKQRDAWQRGMIEARLAFTPVTPLDFAQPDRVAPSAAPAESGESAPSAAPAQALAEAAEAAESGDSAPAPAPDDSPSRIVNPTNLSPYLEAGYTLIPLHQWDYVDARGAQRGKSPRDARWLIETYPPDAISRAIAAGSNVGVRLAETQLVIDYDPRNVPDGRDVLAEFAEEFGVDLVSCPEVRTGSGGAHYYLRMPPGLRVVNGLEGFPGVEFKSRGRQVVAAGSKHPNGEFYAWDLCSPPLCEAPAVPAKLLEAIRRPEPKAAAGGGEGGEVSVQQIERCLALLDPCEFQDHDKWLSAMMSCHSGTNGDPEAREAFIAWSTRDPRYAGDADQIRYRWNSLRPDGGVTIGTLYGFVGDTGRPVPSQPERDFDDLPESETPGSPYMTAAAYAESVKPAPPVIDGMLYGAGVTILYGEEGRGKSYVALDLAFHVASGRASWHGRTLYLHGRAVYIAGEGQHSIPERLRAWATHHGVALDSLGDRFMLRRPGGVNLTAAQVREQMRAELAELRPSLVVVDTLSSVLAGTDENAVKDVSPFLAWCADVASDAGACVLVLHHPAKGSGLARGSSAITANTDGSIKLEGESGKPFRLSVRKVRSGAPMKGLRLELQSVDLGEDPARPGRRIVNAVVVPAPEIGPSTAADLAWELGEAERWPLPRARLVEALSERWGLAVRPIEKRIMAEIPSDPAEARDRLSPVYLARIERTDGRPGWAWEIRPAEGE